MKKKSKDIIITCEHNLIKGADGKYNITMNFNGGTKKEMEFMREVLLANFQCTNDLLRFVVGRFKISKKKPVERVR